MERSEVSRHEVLVYAALSSNKGRWLSNAEIAAALQPGIAERTVRAHTHRLVDLGLLDQAEVFLPIAIAGLS
jgi:DNA-binding transcriptional regulator PaaX